MNNSVIKQLKNHKREWETEKLLSGRKGKLRKYPLIVKVGSQQSCRERKEGGEQNEFGVGAGEQTKKCYPYSESTH